MLLAHAEGVLYGLLCPEAERRGVLERLWRLHLHPTGELLDAPMLLVGVEFEVQIQHGTVHIDGASEELLPPSGDTQAEQHGHETLCRTTPTVEGGGMVARDKIRNHKLARPRLFARCEGHQFELRCVLLIGGTSGTPP